MRTLEGISLSIFVVQRNIDADIDILDLDDSFCSLDWIIIMIFVLYIYIYIVLMATNGKHSLVDGYFLYQICIISIN